MNIDELEVTLKMLNIEYKKDINMLIIDTLKYSSKPIESIKLALESNGIAVVHNYIEGNIYLIELEE